MCPALRHWKRCDATTPPLTQENRTMRAWHFLADDSVMRDGRKAPADGVTLYHPGA